MKAILGTIALEPNRWTGKRNPRFTLEELLPLVREYGFDKIEAWQWHVSTRFVKDIRAIRAQADGLGVSFAYLGVYPAFALEGPEAREEERIQADILDKAELLGCKALKIMLGTGLKGSAATPAQIALTTERFAKWHADAKARGIAMAAELHGNTLFDPVETGIAFMKANPGLDFTICFQPYDFTSTPKALELADRFAGKITHIHLQAPQPREAGGLYDLLAEGRLDYRALLPHILHKNPGATMTLEFVKDCIQHDKPFDVRLVLENARKDALFVEEVVKA